MPLTIVYAALCAPRQKVLAGKLNRSVSRTYARIAKQQDNVSVAPERDAHGVLRENPDAVGDVIPIDFDGPTAIDGARRVNANAVLGFTDEKIRERLVVVWNVTERNPIPTCRHEWIDPWWSRHQDQAADTFYGRPQEARRLPGREAHAAIRQTFAIEPFAELPRHGIIALRICAVVLERRPQRTNHKIRMVSRSCECIPPRQPGPNAAHQPRVRCRVEAWIEAGEGP